MIPHESWENGTDCCAWWGVNCSSITRRITELYLGGTPDFSGTWPYDEQWVLDLRIFAPFDELLYLDLSYNNIGGSLSSKGLPALKKLQYLDLESNGFTGPIPLSLKNFTALRYLNLQSNNLTGELPAQVFTNLVNLHLRENKLNDYLPQSLCNLAYLQLLDVSANYLMGDIPKGCFSNLTSLQYFDVSDNYLRGNFSFLSFFNNSKLKEVSLARNNDLTIQFNYKGWLPQFQINLLSISGCKLDKKNNSVQTFLATQYELEAIDLSHCNLQGDAMNWIFENKTKLEYVNLRNNSLVGTMKLPKHHMNKVSIIDMSDNSIQGSSLTRIQLIFPELSFLNLSHNLFTGNIPSQLCNLTFNDQYTCIDLSNNDFYGKLPSCLMTDVPNLSILILSNNRLTGKLHTGRQDTVLGSLQLSGNMLTGSLPSNLSTSMTSLDIHDNQLSGYLPESIGQLDQLRILSLRGNYFQGTVPNHLCYLIYLEILDLSNNSFSGSLPDCYEPLHLNSLSLGGNYFTGKVPTSFFNYSLIRAFNAEDNKFSGEVEWIGELQNARLLLLSRNHLQGQLTANSCELQYLRLLDISRNKLSGQIPTCLGNLSLGRGENHDDMWLTSIFNSEAVYPADIYIAFRIAKYDILQAKFSTKGNYYTYQGYGLGLMIGFDLSDNKFSGKIPPELGNLTNIKSLNLSYNQLTGQIPEFLSNMRQIESLDLSHNRLTGPIPETFLQLQSLEIFSVAYNNLSGCIPKFENQFATFNISSYVGNPYLHGPPLKESCSSIKALSPPAEKHEDDDIVGDAILYGIAATSFVFGFWTCIAALYWNKKGRYIRARYIDSYVDLCFY